MKPIFQVGVLLLLLELCLVGYWFGTGFYILDVNEEYRMFHAFLIIHLVTMPLAIFYVLEARFEPPKFFLLFPFIIEIFYDIYKLLIGVNYLHKIDILNNNTDLTVAYNIEVAGISIELAFTGLITLWYLYVVFTGATDRKHKSTHRLLQDY